MMFFNSHEVIFVYHKKNDGPKQLAHSFDNMKERIIKPIIQPALVPCL